VPKSAALKESDAVFIKGMDEEYHGNRKKASEDMALRGWQYLSQGDYESAMRRFNQAWLLDSKDGIALWGMAACQASLGKSEDSLKLFAEAEKSVGGQINFAVDYAKAIGKIGVTTNNKALIDDALKRYGVIFKKAPENTLNLQNWAITLTSIGNYSEAWSRVKLAEATPDKSILDPRFLAELETHMPRPQSE
jgi:tetratricopeptide (TPR) repeat protein